GDGAVGFTIAEFDTMVRHGLPVVVVVMNNRIGGASNFLQRMRSGPDRILGTTLGAAHYEGVAQAFGAFGERVGRLEDLVPAIDAALASGLPACIDVAVDGDAGRPPGARAMMTI